MEKSSAFYEDKGLIAMFSRTSHFFFSYSQLGKSPRPI